MKKRFFALLIVIALLGTAASAQIKQADKLFNNYSYSLAIPYYLKIANNAASANRNEAIVRLADCYRLTNDQLNAKTWYAQAVKLPETEPINWYYYGQALRSTEEYELAKEAFDNYAKLAPFDTRGKVYSGFCMQIDKLTAQPAAFEVENAKSLNSKWSDFGPAFYRDGIVYVSDRRKNFLENIRYPWTNANYLSMLFAQLHYKDGVYQDISVPEPFDGRFNKTYHDGPATFAKHDSLIYYNRTEKGNEKKDAQNFRTDRLKIFWSKYKGSWSKAKPFTLNSEQYSVGHPSLSPDGNMLYFVSDMPGGLGGTDIYSCEWKNGDWSKPVNMGDKVNSFGNEMFPSIHGDKLYFASDGWPGFGGLDIFYSIRIKGSWSKPRNLGIPVNSSADDFAMVLDSTGINGFFSSNRFGGAGNDDIYACNRLGSEEKPVFIPDTIFVSGYVKDKQTMKPIAGCTVFLLNTVTGKAKVLKTYPDGQFRSPVDKGVSYVAKGMENNYVSDCISFKVAANDTVRDIYTPRDLLLDLLALDKMYKLNNEKPNVENIYYDFDKWFIRPEAEVELNKLVQLMKENPINIELESHTDSRGSAEYNMALSQKRAESVVNYIVKKGIDSTRITAKGYGETKLVNQCSDGVPCTEEQHQANRRTMFKIILLKTPESKDSTNLNKFKAGDEVPLNQFDKDFFINCLPVKDSSGSSLIKPGSSVNATIPAVMMQSSTSQNTENLQPKDSASEKKAVITYGVQVYALKRSVPLSDAEFANFENIQRYGEGGLYKYTAGKFDNTVEAHAYRDIMFDKGYGDAFVVTFADGKHVTTQAAK